MTDPSAAVKSQLAPTGVLRAGINMSNFLLVVDKTPEGDPIGPSPSIAHAIADALGRENGDFFRSPVTRDMILTTLEQAPTGHDRLMAHI